MDPLKILLRSLLLFALALQAQQEDVAFGWESGEQLTWEDFKAAPPTDKTIAATTASGLSYSFKTRGGPGEYRLDYEVIAYFYPEKSWYHPELCDAMVLKHEQLHFDISEIFARKMRKILSERTFKGNVRAEIRSIFSEINKELSAYQDRYDLETDFSRNREGQLRWNKKIAEKLERTSQ
ncbi:DUF922 domain-containing protein [Robiginitalea sp. M39]|uniref:DUF922 domain-containing protein n=1 Tax=Robiginitalea aurantiaca TaxID=3056915 RepID=A0ABT7WIG4_9FLAO|nr:DUF922 domain-containing protein [Robiginitalea aurantiaca]